MPIRMGYADLEWLCRFGLVMPIKIGYAGYGKNCFRVSIFESTELGIPNLRPDDFVSIVPYANLNITGVKKVFADIIEQWRNSFPREHVARKDKEAQEKGEDKWIPPIMVSWDTDSIDPNAFPCTIAQEANGLSSEECLAFCDEVANTHKMVLMEVFQLSFINYDLGIGVRLISLSSLALFACLSSQDPTKSLNFFSGKRVQP